MAPLSKTDKALRLSTSCYMLVYFQLRLNDNIKYFSFSLLLFFLNLNSSLIIDQSNTSQIFRIYLQNHNGGNHVSEF